MNRIIRTFVILAVLLCNISCDQISKSVVRTHIEPHQRIHLFNNVLTIMKVENTGAFLSAGHNLPAALRFALLSLLPVLALGFGLYILFTKTSFSRLQQTGLCFIIGGGIGNIYDRLRFGSVTDFVHLQFGFFQTGVFNMADVSIMVGTFIMIAHAYFIRKPSNSNNIGDMHPDL